MAGPFSREFVETVRDAGDIVGLISDYVPLKRSGARFKGLCPFHQEKTPSFSVDPNRQLFYCFGCQTGGDIFKFVQLYEKVEFPEAAEQLARRFGVPIPAVARSTGDFRERVLEMNRLAEQFYQARLTDSRAGAACRDYLKRRGLSAETVSRLGLGFAPDDWEALRTHLLGKRFRAEELLRGGLVLERKSGQGQYDRFRNRLVFPIRDGGARTVAFGGRAIGDAEPKYLNSPETPAYVKGNHLYGLDTTREAIRREGLAVVVEGYTDLAALIQAGFDHVVASLGTAFTPAQARLLARYTNRVAFSYDGDSAGAAAATRSLDLLLERGFKVRVVELPGGSDPDDFIRKEGAESYGRLLRQAPEYLEFLVRREVRSRNLASVEEQVAASNAVLPHIARLTSAIERADWAGRLADALGIEDRLVLQELRSALGSARPRIRQRPQEARSPRPVEARLVSLLLESSEARAETDRDLQDDDIAGTQVARIVHTILRLERQGTRVDYPGVLQALEDDIDRSLLTRIAFQEEPEEGPGVADCLWALRRQRLARESRAEARNLAKLQQEAGTADAAEVTKRLVRVQELARQRDALS